MEMKKIFAISICFILGSQFLMAQKPIKFEIKEKKKNVIYLSLSDDKKELESIVSDSENEKDSKKTENSKDNSVNIYFEWINPLKYKLAWKDSTMVDERDKAVNDFVSLLVAQFGKPVSELNIPESAFISELNVNDSTQIEGIEFKDKELLLLLIHLRANESLLNKNDKGEIYKLNIFFNSLKKLDDLVSENVSDSSLKFFSDLYDYKDIKDFNDKFLTQTKEFESIDAKLSKTEAERNSISDKIKTLTIEDKMLQSYANAVLSSYLEKSLLKLNADKKIITKLKPILEIVKSSIERKSSKFDEYFKIRNLSFNNGEKIETILTITEYEFKKETTEFVKKAEVLNKKLVFQKYDLFDLSASTGLFYGNSTLTGFGVANDGTSFKVTEDNLNKNNAIAAVFLNFNFKTSRYFSPLFQLGIDPTKKRPFLLFGGGFSIPAARIALSAGPIWTWNQTLDKLTVGQIINSTTDLEKDIKYKLEVDPKGWYLGIQYNF